MDLDLNIPLLPVSIDVCPFSMSIVLTTFWLMRHGVQIVYLPDCKMQNLPNFLAEKLGVNLLIAYKI
jgi:hypothetical protein